MARRCGLTLEARSEDVSVVWLGTDQEGKQKSLLLSGASGALAAVNNSIPAWDVTHVICVASRKNSDALRAHASGMMVTYSALEEEDKNKLEEETKKRKRQPRRIVFHEFSMADRLRPDEDIDLVTYIEEPLEAIEVALATPGRRDSMVMQSLQGSPNSKRGWW